MNPSAYNFIWPTDDPKKLMIFNSLTLALAEIAPTHIHLLSTTELDYDGLPPEERQFVDGLKQGGFVRENKNDEFKILKYAYNSARYNSTKLELTIAPTLRCNFSCTYCYEQSGDKQERRDGSNVFMPMNVQEQLLNFINQESKMTPRVHVTWYGGEPLLGKEIVFDLSRKIIAITEKNNVDYLSGMLTNGYLLASDPDIVQKLKDSRISYLQVTLDGPPEVHNCRRMLKDSESPTFDRILAGIRLLVVNNFDVHIRINVDRSNMADTLRLLDILEANNLKDIPVYLGRVAAETVGCKFIESTCATMEEFAILNQTFLETLRKRGFNKELHHYPQFAHGCLATRIRTFTIDPDGDIYKCWTEIGDKSARIANIAEIDQRSQGEKMRDIRWHTWEPFEYPECLECKVLPICMGGCAYHAMFVNQNKKPTCQAWKYCLEHFVRERYNLEKEKQLTGKNPVSNAGGL